MPRVSSDLLDRDHSSGLKACILRPGKRCNHRNAT
jgi:hypothetical protein